MGDYKLMACAEAKETELVTAVKSELQLNPGRYLTTSSVVNMVKTIGTEMRGDQVERVL